MANSQRPHGLQPTRLLRPWDFPGRSTGVGCHCLLQLEEQPIPETLFPPHFCSPGCLLCLWNSPAKNTAVSNHSLLQGIFPNPGINSGLLHCRKILYCLSHLGSRMRLQGSKLYPEGRIQPKAGLCKQSFIGTSPRLLIYVWSTKAFTIRAEPSSCDRGHLA